MKTNIAYQLSSLDDVAFEVCLGSVESATMKWFG